MNRSGSSIANLRAANSFGSHLAALIGQLEDCYSQLRDQINDASGLLSEGHELLRAVGVMAAASSLRAVYLGYDMTLPVVLPGPVFDREQQIQVDTGSTVSAVATVISPVDRLEIYTFGQFRIRNGGRTLDRWNNNKAKGILKILLMHRGGPVSKDVFIENLWPSASLKSADNSFRVALHDLRRALGSFGGTEFGLNYVLYDGNTYSLAPDSEMWMDAVEFETLLRKGQSIESKGSIFDAVPIYEEAERLYTGDFLEEDLYEDWAIVRREGLLDAFLAVVSKLVDFHFSQGNYERCIDYCIRVIEKDQCREEVYRKLILCHMSLGQRNRAIRWYEICRASLRKEWNFDVSADTRSIYETLFRNTPE